MVNFLLLGLMATSGFQPETPVQRRIHRAIVELLQPGQEPATGVDLGNGFFLVHRSACTAPSVLAKTKGNVAFNLSQVSVDKATGLGLYQCLSGPIEGLHPAHLPLSFPPAGSQVWVATPKSLVPGQLVTSNRLGSISASNRVISLSEIKLESVEGSLAGAPVFSGSGDLVGILSANLPGTRSNRTVPVQSFAAPSGRSEMSVAAKMMSTQNQGFGPGGLTVAYSAGPELLQRVISGFLSPSHKVEHPMLGIFVQDVNGLCHVQRLSKGSPGERAGIKVGDQIEQVGNTPIQSAANYARTLLTQQIGREVTIRVVRDGNRLQFSAVVAKLED